MDTTNKQSKLSIEKAELFLKLDSRIVEFEIKKTVFGYRKKKYANDFLKPIEENPKCYLKLFGLDPEEVEFKVSTDKSKKVFFGHLKRGIPVQLGINFQIVISEIWQDDTKTFSYGIDTSISYKEEREISDFARNLFDLPDKPNNDKPQKKKGAK